MKRLLIVAFGVPPTRGPNPGRAWHFARHLPAHGWEAILLTPRHPNRRFSVDKTREHRSYPIPVQRVLDPSGAPYWLQQTGYRDVLFSLRRPEKPEGHSPIPGLYGRQVRNDDEVALDPPPNPTHLLQRLLCWTRCNPDARAGWVIPGLQAARAVCRTLKPDAVYSISPPVSAHRIAMRVAENLKIPWIADLREPWSGGSPSFLDGWRRSRILRGARVYQLPPSFDPVDLQGGSRGVSHSGSSLVLVHAGPTSTRGRSAVMLLEAVRHLLDAKVIDPHRLRIRFLGPRDDRLSREVGARFLSGIVTIEPDVPWEVSLETQAEADGLLLALGPGDRHRIPDRLLEGFATGKEMIGFGAANDSISEVLQRTGTGNLATDSAILATHLKAWCNISPRTLASRDVQTIDRFRAEIVVKGLVELLEKLDR